MPQQPRVKVRLAAVRVDELAVLGLRHRVHGEVAPLQVLLECYLGGELRREAAVAGRHLALQARQCVLLVRLRMQEDGELAPHRRVAQALELCRLGTHDHPVALVHGPPEQPVPDGAAD